MSKPGSEILERHKSVAIKKANLLLFSHSDALEVIRDCRIGGVTILGMNFWWDRSGTPVETLGAADFSYLLREEDPVNRSADSAERILGMGMPDGTRWVSFVLMDEDELHVK